MMEGDKAQRELSAALDCARKTGQILGPLEVARHAREAGLLLVESLAAVRKHATHKFGIVDSPLEEALASLVCTLAASQGAVRVLEYTADHRLLIAKLAQEGRYGVSIFALSAAFAEALTLLLEGTNASVSTGVPTESPTKEFGAIICAPPLGVGINGGDGFGGEAVASLLPALASEGILCWITGRGVLFHQKARDTFSTLATLGLYVAAIINLAPGSLGGTRIEGALIVFRRQRQKQKLVGAMRDPDDAASIVAAFDAGPSKQQSANWTWLPIDDPRSFMDIEHDRLRQKMLPKGKHELKTIRSMLAAPRVERADRPLPNDLEGASLLFVPEYAGSRVTADIEEQTVNPRSVYRLVIDDNQANPRFLSELLNSPYGKKLRSDVARGTTMQRVSVDALLSLELAIPDVATQERIARVNSDIRLLQGTLRDMQVNLQQDWTAIHKTAEGINALKEALEIERGIAQWWRELPYPLATIYRRYQVTTDSKERIKTLIHFFEMFSVYIAVISASHVKMLRQDWQQAIKQLLHTRGPASITRPVFGYWINLAKSSLAEIKRITSTSALNRLAIEMCGPEIVQYARIFSTLDESIELLDYARLIRNKWIGHGGHMKDTDAHRLILDLENPLRELYGVTSIFLRSVQLVRPGKAEVTDTGLVYNLELLSGSDPTFVNKQVEIDRGSKSGALAFWATNGRTLCRALPLLRLGSPSHPHEASCYVFSGEDKGNYNWICYHEALEQIIVANDEDLRFIMELRNIKM